MAQQQNTSIFAAGLVGPVARESFTKLDPRQLVRNPVMFTTAIVALLATVLLVRNIVVGGDIAFEAQIVFWLWLTVLFGNFAESLAADAPFRWHDTVKHPLDPTLPQSCLISL